MTPGEARAVVAPLARALYDVDAGSKGATSGVFAPDALIRLAHPFGDFVGGAAFWDGALAPLLRAMPDMERRPQIEIAGQDADGAMWVGHGGLYAGTFEAPFLDIPATGRVAHMRYHEFFRIEDGAVVEMQALWDIPEVMMQAGAWPMRSEEHTSELQSPDHLVCRLLLEKKKKKQHS